MCPRALPRRDAERYCEIVAALTIRTENGKGRKLSTARSKGKVERPFRTVKEAHETLYHFHAPQTEAEANPWLVNYIDRYNERPHRREPHSRVDDWLGQLPEQGVRQMCWWERFCAFAREPERRKVGGDARISVQGTYYEVDGDLAGEEVLLWWGLFDHEMFAELGEKRYGPYRPVGGPIPLHRYRARKKSTRDKRADRVTQLAEQISVPRSALGGCEALRPLAEVVPIARTAFVDPDPWHQIDYANPLAARRGIAALIRRPLGRLPANDLRFTDELLGGTLERDAIAKAVSARFGTAR